MMSIRTGVKLVLLAIALYAARSSAFVYESPTELSGTGDFNGNGTTDLVIVDRATGLVRIGYQLSPGTYTWSDPRASGMENAEWLSVGRLLQTTRDSLALTSRSGNRVNLLDAPGPGSPFLPISVFAPGVGPNMVLAINIPGAGDTAHSDLLVSSDQNNPPNRGQYALLRNNAGNATVLTSGNYAEMRSGNRMQLKATGPDVAGIIVRSGTNEELRIVTASPSGLTQIGLIPGLPVGAGFLVGNFAGSAFNHVLIYRPGQNSFTTYLASEPSPGTVAFTTGTTFNLGAGIVSLITLRGAAVDRLAAVFLDGTAKIYTFNGNSPPVLVQGIGLDSGEGITALLPVGNHDFVALSGKGGITSSARYYQVNGTGYVAGPRTVLPLLSAVSASANLFLFGQEPFVSQQPGLLRSLKAGDWSSDPKIVSGSPPTFSATIWDFEGGSAGLRNPVSVMFGPVAPSTGYILANQYSPAISISSRAPAIGDEVLEVKILPPAGEYKTAIHVALSSRTAGTQFHYRFETNGQWNLYTSPFPLFKSTRVEYYGSQAGTSLKSRIQTAEYHFPTSPSIQDSDRDGVPDYVEIAKGLDPNGGSDQDGDGFTDLNELVAGTNPLDGTSYPADAQRLEQKAGFDLVLGLQPLDGVTGNATQPALNVGLRAYDLSGSLLGTGVTATRGIAGVSDPAVELTNIVLSAAPSLLVAATDAHFDIATTTIDKTRGRELIGVIAAPRPLVPPVSHVYGGGSLGAEASAWITAAQSLYGTLPREQVKSNLDVNDTLVSLLFERKISELLMKRGDAAGVHMTLTPFRSADRDRTNPSLPSLASLEGPSEGAMAYKLTHMHRALETMVASSTPAGMNHLKRLAAEVYRISSLSNNAAPGRYPSPVNVIREFLEKGVVHSNYLGVLPTTIDLAAAHNSYKGALANVSPRPLVDLQLLIRADTFAGACTRLDTMTSPPTQKILIHPGGVQYRLLESFHLIPGSRVRILGYADAQSPDCSGDAIEVLSISLESVPEATPVDMDGDLLLDSFEYLLFGSLGQNGQGDADGDGYTNLQELLDGTDPINPNSKGATVVSLGSPDVSISGGAPGQPIILRFRWPSAYIDKVQFAIRSTTELGTAFTSQVVSPVNIGPNTFQVVLPNPGTQQKFFVLSLSAKPM